MQPGTLYFAWSPPRAKGITNLQARVVIDHTVWISSVFEPLEVGLQIELGEELAPEVPTGEALDKLKYNQINLH